MCPEVFAQRAASDEQTDDQGHWRALA
ncbi:hypothetical protein A2U01_0102435, partial [Trifolium medium]|nr:hypothetical protein [Trifolium medium]